MAKKKIDFKKIILLSITSTILFISTLAIFVYFRYRYTYSEVVLMDFEKKSKKESVFIQDMLSTIEFDGESFEIPIKVNDLGKDFKLLSATPFNEYGYMINYMLTYKDRNIAFIHKTPIKNGSIFQFIITDDEINGNMVTIGGINIDSTESELLATYPYYSNVEESILENGSIRKTYYYYDTQEVILEEITFVILDSEIVEISLFNR